MKKCRDVLLINLKNNVTNNKKKVPVPKLKKLTSGTSINSEKRCFRETSLKAFTLVELIVTITILAIL
jgi:prepilin-type N-terminal cleavage/methylation domain-containing protein